MSTTNTALLNTVLDQVQGEDFKRQLLEDLGTAMTHRASRIGNQHSQRVALPTNSQRDERPADVTKEDNKYIRRMCNSSRRTFARL